MISIDFASLFVIFQRVFQLTSFTFVNPLFWRKEISDILSVMDVLSWLQPENQHIRTAPGELCKSFSASSFFNKNQNNPPDFEDIVSILPDFMRTNVWQCFNCRLSSQLWSFINSQGKLLTP